MIQNKVKESELITLDLSALLPRKSPVLFDLKPFLYKELIIKEKDFRAALEQHDWAQYAEQIVLVFCSADSIIPVWAYMLVAVHLKPFASNLNFDNLHTWKQKSVIDEIRMLDLSSYTDKRIVIKGCGDEKIDDAAYFEITNKLLPVVKSLMYGEPCSTVPVYKRK